MIFVLLLQVAALYHDASVGAAINIVVVRLFILDSERVSFPHHANLYTIFCTILLGNNISYAHFL